MSGRPRQPIELVIANGKKHLTKAEIEERKNQEVKPITDDIRPPDYLTKKQKEEFEKIANQLEKLDIMGETDCDALARYIIENDEYINCVKQLRKSTVKNNPILYDAWSKAQERAFKKVRQSAVDLGLTISSRCKLVVPKSGNEPEKKNKFSKFEKGGKAVNG